jgi:uncharacterized protein (TIGR03086 family)
MSQDIVDRVTSLVNSFDARVQAAPSDGWGAPAPCTDWTARDVVVHVGNNLGGMAAGLTGQTPTPIADDDDIVDAWTTRRDAFFAAIQTADLNTVVPGPMGPMPAAQVIGRLISMDVLVHTWDLAKATGGDLALDVDAVTMSYSGIKPMDAMIRQPGLFGPKLDTPAGADIQTEFLRFLGRPA